MQQFAGPVWTNAADAIPAGARPPVIPLPVSIRVVLGAEDFDPGALDEAAKIAMLFALDEVTLANQLLSASRVGIALAVRDTVTIVASGSVIAADCLTAEGLTGAYLTPGVLNLHYLGGMGSRRGLTCSRFSPVGSDGRPGPVTQVIYLSYLDRMMATLTHESGHALGLDLPGAGHIDGVEGFDGSNLMVSLIDDLVKEGRTRFTIGQAFEMNADSGSWVNWAASASGQPARTASDPRLACPCGAVTPACPPRSADIILPGPTYGTLGNTSCADLIRVPTIAGEEPVGLLASRRWRSPPSQCAVVGSRGLSSEAEFQYLQFEDMSDPATCPSWLAVFFRKGGMLFARLSPAADQYWSDIADHWEWLPKDTTTALVPVKVAVYFPHGFNAKRIVDGAESRFGPDNRAGLAFTNSLFESTPCPAPPDFKDGTYYLCIVGVGQTAPAAPAIGLDVTASDSALAFDLGRAFGLTAVTGTGAFLDNVMQAVPKDRGTHLTLGQVFRLHSLLRGGTLPDCRTPSAECPPDSVDVVSP